jgi:outer membrane protein TolC
MRFLRPIIASVVLLTASVNAAPSPAAPLTLAQAFAAVETVNPDVLLSREAVAQANELVRQQRAANLPIIAATAQQRRAEAVSITGGLPVQAPAANRFDARLTGAYALLNATQRSAVDSARAGTDVAKFDYQATLQAVLSRVAQGYFTHLRNVRRIDVLDANTARANALLTLARNQQTAGVATQIDVTRAEAQLAVAEQARLQQDTTVYQSALYLAQLLDLPADRPLALENFAVRQAAAPAPGATDDAAVKGQRADFLRTARALDQSKIDVRTARFERLPILALTADYGYAAAGFDERDTKQAWSAGASVSVPVFDGMRASADRRAAMSRQRGAEQRLRRLELQITAELRLAAQDASSRHAQIAVADTGLRLAEEELRLAQQRFEQGVADNREVIEAQTRLALASDNLVEAVYQYNLSRVELARTKGDVRSVLTEKAE